MKKITALSLLMFILGTFAGLGWGARQIEKMKHQMNLLYMAKEQAMLKELEKIKQQKVKEFKIEIWTATGYAPLDPKAKEGVCFSGNRKITASGKEVDPQITVAADPSIPFGTWIWIEGFGWRRVDDRGGRIKGKKIDICFQKQEEALKFGRQKRIVVIPVWEKEDE